MLSPNKELVAVSCGGKRNQTLTVISQDGLAWKLDFIDYLPKRAAERGSPGILSAIKWTPDSKYLYFASGISYSGGGSCFYRGDDNVEGLFRLDVNNGNISVVLPLVEDQVYMFSPYYISFSPTGRRLIYEGYKEPRIIDLQTGEETILEIPDGFASGSYVWSPNGSELAYSICDSMSLGEGRWIETESAIKVFSIFDRESRTILRADYNFMTVLSWNENNILEIQNIDIKNNHDYSIKLIDMSTEQVVTPTPIP
jgi:Tol biopolymer transport system component